MQILHENLPQYAQSRSCWPRSLERLELATKIERRPPVSAKTGAFAYYCQVWGTTVTAHQIREVVTVTVIPKKGIIQLSDAPDNNQSDTEKPAQGNICPTKDAEPKPPEQQATSHKRKHTWLEKFAVFFAGLAFGASVWQGWVARDTEKRSLRAYVFLVPDNEVTVDVFPSKTAIGQIEVNVRNSGQTPAYDVVANSWVALEEWPPPSDFKYTGPPDPKGDSRLILAPGGVQHYHTGTARPFTDQEWQEIEAGTKSFYVYGSITYTDAFGYPRYTNFCLASAVGIDRVFKNAIAHCPRHNDSD